MESKLAKTLALLTCVDLNQRALQSFAQTDQLEETSEDAKETLLESVLG